MMYLYVKTHTVTGLKYLGKTSRENYHDYYGSGKRWLSHLKIHGFTYSTEILLATEDKNDFKRTALFFSRLWNVAKSDNWANMRQEEGDGGDTSAFVNHFERGKSISRTVSSKEWKDKYRITLNEKISNSEKQTKSSPEWKETVGKRVSEEAIRRQNDPLWKTSSGGLAMSSKAKARWADKNFKDDVSKKISLAQQDPAWRLRNYKECPCCKRSISPCNYKKHFNACERKQAVKAA